MTNYLKKFGWSVQSLALLLVVGLFMVLTLTEVVQRLTVVPTQFAPIEKREMRLAANPKIGFEPIPKFPAQKSMDLYGFVLTSNRLGFRDRDHDVQKPSGVSRILVLGDSAAQGIFIPKDEDIFPALLEKYLKERELNAEVLNFSVIGYNTQQEVETLKDKGLAFNPDLVILAYCLNDRHRVDGGIYDELIFGTSVTSQIDQDTVEEYLGVLSKLSQDHKFKALVVMLPDFAAVDKGEKPYPFESEHEKMRQITESKGCLFLDLLPECIQFKKDNPNSMLGFDGWHPRAEGHRFIADAIAKYIINNNFIRGEQ